MTKEEIQSEIKRLENLLPHASNDQEKKFLEGRIGIFKERLKDDPEKPKPEKKRDKKKVVKPVLKQNKTDEFINDDEAVRKAQERAKAVKD